SQRPCRHRFHRRGGPAHRPAGGVRMRARPRPASGLPPQPRRFPGVSIEHRPRPKNMQRVAIVGVGGMFPGAPSPEALWELVRHAGDASREVPPGRWLLPPAAILDPSGPRPDRVYSVRGYFLEPFSWNPQGLDLDPDLLRRLDPLFHLTLHAGRQAWRSGVT